MGKRILVLDEPYFFGAHIDRLREEGFQVECVNPVSSTRIRDVQAALKTQTFKAIIVEPVLFCDDELRTLAELLRDSGAKIVVLSTCRQLQFPKTIRGLKASFQTKPFLPSELVRLVQKLIAN